MAKRNTAIHATGGLFAYLRLRQGRDEVAEMHDPFCNRRISVVVAGDFQKPSRLTHDSRSHGQADFFHAMPGGGAGLGLQVL